MIELIWLISAVFFGFAGFKIAEKKRRNPYAWGFFSAVFPPTILILLNQMTAAVSSKDFLNFDEKWSDLSRYDPDIKSAVEELAPFGKSAVEEFKLKYHKEANKASIPLIVSDIKGERTALKVAGAEEFESHKGTPIFKDVNGMFYVDGKQTVNLNTARTIAAGAARRR